MNDIAKMRRELEEKIRIAELENKYNETLEKHGICIAIFAINKEGRYQASFRKAGEDRFAKALNEHDAQTALNLLPATEDKRVYVGNQQYEMYPYEMETSRTPKKPTVLKIEWIHDGLELWFELPINEQNTELMQYFQRTQRELNMQEIGLYYGAVSPQERDRVQMLPFLTFNCGKVVRFQGGHHKQVSRGHLECIAQSIMNDDFAWER